MDREPGNQGLVPRPQLVDLRGELHEVAGNRGSGSRWVPDLGEQAVEGVTELVEHRDHVVPGQQAGSTLDGAGEIAGVRHHGQGTGQLRLVHQGGHPRPATLGGSGERIEDHRTQRGAVFLTNLVHLGLRGETAQIGPRVEGDAVESGRGGEDALVQHPVILQVGTQQGRVDGLGG